MKKLNITPGSVHADEFGMVWSSMHKRVAYFDMHCDDALLHADAHNTYHATQMLPSEMAERIKALEDALSPFTHTDLCETLGGNVQGDASPLFGRNKAILKLGHFKAARTLLAPPIDEAHGHLLNKLE